MTILFNTITCELQIIENWCCFQNNSVLLLSNWLNKQGLVKSNPDLRKIFTRGCSRPSFRYIKSLWGPNTIDEKNIASTLKAFTDQQKPLFWFCTLYSSLIWMSFFWNIFFLVILFSLFSGNDNIKKTFVFQFFISCFRQNQDCI